MKKAIAVMKSPAMKSAVMKKTATPPKKKAVPRMKSAPVRKKPATMKGSVALKQASAPNPKLKSSSANISGHISYVLQWQSVNERWNCNIVCRPICPPIPLAKKVSQNRLRPYSKKALMRTDLNWAFLGELGERESEHELDAQCMSSTDEDRTDKKDRLFFEAGTGASKKTTLDIDKQVSFVREQVSVMEKGTSSKGFGDFTGSYGAPEPDIDSLDNVNPGVYKKNHAKIDKMFADFRRFAGRNSGSSSLQICRSTSVRGDFKYSREFHGDEEDASADYDHEEVVQQIEWSKTSRFGMNTALFLVRGRDKVIAELTVKLDASNAIEPDG